MLSGSPRAYVSFYTFIACTAALPARGTRVYSGEGQEARRRQQLTDDNGLSPGGKKSITVFARMYVCTRDEYLCRCVYMYLRVGQMEKPLGCSIFAGERTRRARGPRKGSRARNRPGKAYIYGPWGYCG